MKCTKCGGRKDRSDRKTCARCRKDSTARTTAYRAERRMTRTGDECSSCKRPARPGFKRCQTCSDRCKKANRKYREKITGERGRPFAPRRSKPRVEKPKILPVVPHCYCSATAKRLTPEIAAYIGELCVECWQAWRATDRAEEQRALTEIAIARIPARADDQPRQLSWVPGRIARAA